MKGLMNFWENWFLFPDMVHRTYSIDENDSLKIVKVLKPFNHDDDDVAVFGWQKYLRETKETKWGDWHAASSGWHRPHTMRGFQNEYNKQTVTVKISVSE